MAQVIEHPSKCEVLSSNPSTTKESEKERERERQRKRERNELL
jgi:hypothetical protein